MLYDAVQIAGSALILVTFVAALAGRLDQSGYRYLLANAAGSAVLAGTAIISHEWGFVLLESVWSLVSWVALIRKARGRTTPTAH